MKNKIIVFILLIVIGLLPAVDAHGLGVSPSPITRDNVSNGVRMRTRVNVVRSSALDKDVLIEVQLQGESSRYLELTQESFIIPKGQKQAVYEFFISPQSAPNGHHEAMLLFTNKGPVNESSQAGSSGNSGASILEAMLLGVNFIVTDNEVKEFNVSSFAVEDTEVGLPLQFSYVLENNGNVDGRIDKIEVLVVDTTDSSHEYRETFLKEQNPLLAPGEHKEMVLFMNQTIPQGEYQFSAVFYFNNENIFSISDRLVEVLPPGSLGQEAKFISFLTEKERYKKDELLELIGILENTGDVGLRANLYVEVRDEDDIRIDLLRSDDKFVLKGKKGEFRIQTRLSEIGLYNLKAYVEFGAGKSEYKNLQIEIFDDTASIGLFR
ncbi:MAG: hypothetical protein ABIJ23_00900, partial [Candidatus Magasanikbacteria bacterium]